MLENPEVKPSQVNSMLRTLSKVLDYQDVVDLTSDTVDFYIRRMHEKVDPESLVQFLEFAMSRDYKLPEEDLDGFRLYLIKNDMVHKEIGKKQAKTLISCYLISTKHFQTRCVGMLPTQ